jgi:phosphopantothenoylcysteine decarboxylase/phosphopantothenate--cysteine ligase
MDVDMYRHEATQATIALLRERGCVIVEPAEGELASGLTGPGRLPEVEVLLSQIALVLTSAHRDLQGRRVLVTAGPTHEPIDPVRYVGNRSSGKMGFAVARAAAERGAEVTLISGPVEREAPRHVRRIDVRTATEMHEAVLREFEQADLLVMAAAVADFAPVQPVASKIKREAVTGGSLMLELKPNPDILKAVGPVKRGRLVVGFALETEAEEENARRKLVSKSLDLIVMNNPTREGSGFGGDTNVVTLLAPDGTVERLPRMPKIQVAHAILDRVVAMLTPAGRG